MNPAPPVTKMTLSHLGVLLLVEEDIGVSGGKGEEGKDTSTPSADWYFGSP